MIDANDLQQIINIIVNLPISSDALKVLLKATTYKPDHVWYRDKIQEFLNIGDYKLRQVLSELKKIGCLNYTYQRDEHGCIDKKFITINVDNLLINNKTDHYVENPSCCSSTDIVYYNNTSSNINTCCIHVENQHNGEPLRGKSTTWSNAEMELQLENIPKIMTGFKSWLYWKSVSNGDKKPKKLPCTDIADKNWNDPAAWKFFKDVHDYKARCFDGILFVLSKNDPFVIIDLDSCFINGVLTEQADKIVKYFNTYTEYSISGAGLHIICRAQTDKNIIAPFELYSCNRSIVMSGNVYLNAKIEDRQKQVDATLAKYAKESKPKPHYDKPSNGKFTMPKETFHEGCRNNSLTRWAGILRSKNMPENDYNYYLEKINKECCIPPLENDELKIIANSVKRY